MFQHENYYNETTEQLIFVYTQFHVIIQRIKMKSPLAATHQNELSVFIKNNVGIDFGGGASERAGEPANGRVLMMG